MIYCVCAGSWPKSEQKHRTKNFAKLPNHLLLLTMVAPNITQPCCSKRNHIHVFTITKSCHSQAKSCRSQTKSCCPQTKLCHSHTKSCHPMQVISLLYQVTSSPNQTMPPSNHIMSPSYKVMLPQTKSSAARKRAISQGL